MKSWFCFLLFSLPVLAGQPQTTQCTSGDSVRLIEVVYPEGGELPCEVRYTRDGEQQVLWRARNEVGYCAQKAAEFIERQRGWGYQCHLLPASRSTTE